MEYKTTKIVGIVFILLIIILLFILIVWRLQGSDELFLSKIFGFLNVFG